LTGGWGDANSGGYFGSYLKFSGFDAVFFTGISSKPVYLLIDNGRAEIKDAANLWGKDTYETEDTLMAEYGSTSRVACIGPSGEKVSLIAGIMTGPRKRRRPLRVRCGDGFQEVESHCCPRRNGSPGC